MSPGPSQQAPRSRASSSGKRIALLMIGVAAVARLPGNSRAQQHAIMLGIFLGAAAGLTKDSQAQSRARLVAWDKRRNLRYLRTLEAQAKKLGDSVTG
jgi:hypothetical protein